MGKYETTYAVLKNLIQTSQPCISNLSECKKFFIRREMTDGQKTWREKQGAPYADYKVKLSHKADSSWQQLIKALECAI